MANVTNTHPLGSTVFVKMKVDNLPSSASMNDITKVEFFPQGKYNPEAVTGYQVFQFSNGTCTGNAIIDGNYIVCAVDSTTIGTGTLAAYVHLTSSVKMGSKTVAATSKVLVEFKNTVKIGD